ncbi:MAG: glutamate--tRNA ligase [Deltaproteobacteria bacterium]|nr:glutamate--tRNA ligase [Deltaproteobacteria bacterium]
MSEVRVRFAPSPTGYLHIGGARTALYNWLYARKHNGTFVLRIEDTDEERSTRESIDEILDGLAWMGLQWDEGPYFQSERLETHQQAVQQLLANGSAYRCFCTKEELEAKRAHAQEHKLDYKYDGTCRNLTQQQVQDRVAAGQAFVVRFKTPRQDGCIAFEDRVYGRVEKHYDDIEDFVILRSDGKPLYLLSSAIDDMTDRITHVIRGQDGLGNTPRQILILSALGHTPPVYAHISLTLDTKKAKISKRKHGEVVTVAYYKERGFLPWALCNFLLLLGWSNSEDREFFTREELIEAFDLEGIARHNSVFNYTAGDPNNFTDPKAVSMNARYISMLDMDELLPCVKAELQKSGLWQDAFESEKKQWLRDTVELMRTRLHTINDFSTRGRPYFADDFEFEEQAVEKNLKKDERVKTLLPRVADALAALAVFDHGTIEQALRDFCDQEAIKPGLIINAIRTACTGQSAGPGLFELVAAIGKERTVARLRAAAAML